MTGLIARLKDAYQEDGPFLAVLAVMTFGMVALGHACIWLMRAG